MSKKYTIYSVRIFSLILFVVSMSVLVNRTEAAHSASSGLQYQVCQNFDLVYVLDLSGSMGWGYSGAGSRLDAAKDAIVQMNNVLEEDGAGVEASLITWQGMNVSIAVDFTNDFNSISTVVNGLSAGGGTPTALAMQGTKNHLQANLDPNRQPIVLFITDGIPTYDLDGNGYYDYYVNEVPIINPYGGYYPSHWVRDWGAYYNRYGRHAGYPLADAMVAIDDLTNSVDTAQMHSIAILGTDFRQDLLYYAADKGGGEYFGANNANQLAAAIQQAVYSGDCLSTLGINVDNTAQFTLGGQPQAVDPNLTVTGDNENVSSADVHIADHFDASNDSLFVGPNPADSGMYNGLTWWYEAANGTLRIVGVDTPEAYQDLLSQVHFGNSATSVNATNMNTRRINFTIQSALLNVADNGNLTDDGFVEMNYLSGTDYGDAPASYGAAGQNADMFLHLGQIIDVEPSANTSNAAEGDDNHNQDDEDGISFINGAVLQRGNIGTVEATVLNNRTETASISGWIDFNRNGQFEPTEKLMGFSMTFSPYDQVQVKSDAFAVPGDAVCGPTIARFRLSTAAEAATGVSNNYGEVEDYVVEISCAPIEIPDDFDFGDAPESYGDAMHQILPGMTLGQTVDSEAIALSTNDATGDDLAGQDDEDGISFPNGAIGYLGQTIPVEITARNSVHLDAYINGWIDWNQDGQFDDNSEKVISNEELLLSTQDQLFSRQITIPTNAACDETIMRVRIASESVGPSELAASGEAEDIEFFVDCSVEQGIKITPNLSSVQLEETLELLVEADNQGPNLAPNSVVTVTLPVGLDLTGVTPAGSWSCSNSNNDTVVVCEHPLMPVSGYLPVMNIEARVPGTYPTSNIAGTGVIESTFPEKVGEEADNTTTYDVNVTKEWTGEGIPTSQMDPFSHVIYDAALGLTGEAEADFNTDELIINPLQVPLMVVPGVDLPNAPLLIAKYCQTHSTGGCTTADAIITGTIKLNSYTIDTFMLQDVNPATGDPYDATSASNLLDQTYTITYGAFGDGRYVESDLDTCLSWIGQMGNAGNCQTRYDVFKTYPDFAQYVWDSGEYFEIITQTSGGRNIECSGASGECVQLTSSQPGLYRMSGTIQAELIFNDPLHNRIDTYTQSFDYPFTIYIQLVSSFIESDR
ncbi:MAG: vWA domain-containing protein [Chloroflexota bacterium]